MTSPADFTHEPVRDPAPSRLHEYLTAPLGLSDVFAQDEPVLQGRPLLPGVEIPPFGRTDRWLFEAQRRPANVAPSGWIAVFDGFPRQWNLRVREISMSVLNPQHPALLKTGVCLDRDPYQPGTVMGMLSELRVLIEWVREAGLSLHPAHWTSNDMHRFIAEKSEIRSTATVRNYVGSVRLLHELAPALTGGGLAADPWPGRSARTVAKDPATDEVSTPNIRPEVWFPLIKAAWTYIDTFSADIITARDTHLRLAPRPSGPLEPLPEHVIRWLAGPDRTVPLHHGGCGQAGEPNWSLLAELMGRGSGNAFSSKGHAGNRVSRAREIVLQALAEGRGRPGSLIEHLTEVDRPDGSRGPWHPGIDPWALGHECRALRAACYIFVAAMSMMRDSEIREVVRGSVVAEFYGAPAIVSRKRKQDPGRPMEHWWIIEPVARAILVAEELSAHPELVFADPGLPGSTTRINSYEHSVSRKLIEKFIEHVNETSDHTGLEKIPADKVAPHMFRKTMSMLVATEPGAEIALGLQLKHAATRALANRSTQGYGASDANWSRLLDTAIEDARFMRLRDLYDQHHAGAVIGYGPGADKLTNTFNSVKKAAIEATRTAKTGDKRTEYDLLHKTRVTLRFGKLNHCTLDHNHPDGAKCLEEAVVPAGHTGPLIDRCQPGRCPNSVITPDHLQIWKSEEHSLLTLLETHKIAPCRRDQLNRQLDDVRSVIRRAEK
ncbi:integrase [Streptomyces sp. BHT-5-2]|uniref:integrase n=1 Tax=Streptomyces sp. BHT-5-2 TaxID=2866715 RepID=UPI001C8E07D6|nr:integrase [Streptomyces sp. BHT-5-2]QZL01910.1 integrase [Streptomyces sp. BHT-5-2]